MARGPERGGVTTAVFMGLAGGLASAAVAGAASGTEPVAIGADALFNTFMVLAKAAGSAGVVGGAG